MPERLKNKSKANVINSDRSNDFVDNNNYPYISAMAYMIICEDEADIMGDNEFWGLEAAIFISKYNGGAALACYVLD